MEIFRCVVILVKCILDRMNIVYRKGASASYERLQCSTYAVKVDLIQSMWSKECACGKKKTHLGSTHHWKRSNQGLFGDFRGQRIRPEEATINHATVCDSGQVRWMASSGWCAQVPTASKCHHHHHHPIGSLFGLTVNPMTTTCFEMRSWYFPSSSSHGPIVYLLNLLLLIYFAAESNVS